jgi:hypothetical protein
MPGTIVFKPIEAKLKKSTGLEDKVDSYCMFIMGKEKIQGPLSDLGGKHPHWQDSVNMKIDDQSSCIVQLKNHKTLASDDNIGSFEMDLNEVEKQGQVKKWYPLFHKEKTTGEILVEATFTEDIPKEDELPTFSNVLSKESRSEIQQEKVSQGDMPSGIDMTRYAQEERWYRTEPHNSQARIAETNEFGDYQPTKQLCNADLLQAKGTGKIEQGMYYSGQQTSYGEDFPMTHKSVALGPYCQDFEIRQKLGYREPNPRDYAAYQLQAFEPRNLQVNMDENPSVVEKAYNRLKEGEVKMIRGGPIRHVMPGSIDQIKNPGEPRGPKIVMQGDENLPSDSMSTRPDTARSENSSSSNEPNQGWGHKLLSKLKEIGEKISM